jgi:hypothetical protein
VLFQPLSLFDATHASAALKGFSTFSAAAASADIQPPRRLRSVFREAPARRAPPPARIRAEIFPCFPRPFTYNGNVMDIRK